jgi:hypothetical protein
MIDVWPPLPIAIWGQDHKVWGVDNIIAALEHNERVCEIDVWRVPSSQSEKILATLEQPFPELTGLRLGFEDETGPVDPSSFLGGFVPRLQILILSSVPFPGSPKLLLSATHLVNLCLLRIPYSGYFSPEAMATCLSVLIRLKKLDIEFESPRSRPDGRSRRPPPTRALLPVLTELRFKGVSEYLEDLVGRIDTPSLDNLFITFFHQLVFDTPQLARFISRVPEFKAYNEAHVLFSNRDIRVTLPQAIDDGMFELGIPCRHLDWQLSSLAQICGSSFPQALIPAVEHLYIIEDRFPQLPWQDSIESSQWLELFHPFTAVKSLYISREFVPRIAPALRELVGERVTEALPALQTLFLQEPPPSGPVRESIGQFVAARQLAGHPVVDSRWERKKKVG